MTTTARGRSSGGRVIRSLAPLVALVVLAGGCSLVSSADEPCGRPALIAADPEMTIGFSCSVMVEYLGTDYHVSCARVHPSWVGDILTRDGGETDYLEIRTIAGVDPSQGFLLLGHERPCPWSVANAEDGGSRRLFSRILLPRDVRLRVEDPVVSPGQVVTIRLEAPENYSHGVAMTAVRVKPRPPLVRSLEETGPPGRLDTQRLWVQPEVAVFGFTGSRTWRWQVPDLPPGRYELRKEVVWDEPPQFGWYHPSSKITTRLTILRH